MITTLYCTGSDISGLSLAILLVSFLILSSGQNDERLAYCNISTEPITQEWKLFCQFQVDLRKSKQGFEVHHVKRGGSPDVVVEGTWIEDEYKTYTADGYVLDGPVTDQFVIRMQNHVVHSGQIYTCTLPLTLLENVKTCQVPKKEADSTAIFKAPPAVHKLRPDSPCDKRNTPFSSDILQNRASSTVDHEKTLLLITAAITYGIMCRYV